MRGSPGGWHTDGSSLMTLWPGHATDDGVGLHYIGTTLHEDVTIREGSPARYVEPAGDGETTEIVMSARLL